MWFRKHDAEADVEYALIRLIDNPVLGSRAVRTVIPRSSAGAAAIIRSSIGGPFPGVADCVVKAPSVRRVMTNLGGDESTVIEAIIVWDPIVVWVRIGDGFGFVITGAGGAGGEFSQPAVAEIGVGRVVGIGIAEGKCGGGSGAARPFPLDVAGQRGGQGMRPAEPACKGFRIIP